MQYLVAMRPQTSISLLDTDEQSFFVSVVAQRFNFCFCNSPSAQLMQLVGILRLYFLLWFQINFAESAEKSDLARYLNSILPLKNRNAIS